MSFNDKFKEHISNNRGKYGAAAGAGAIMGGIKLGANGYLGATPKKIIQDIGGDTVRALNTSAQYDKIKGDIDAGLTVYKKPDNVLTNPGDENHKMLVMDRIRQIENVPFVLKKGAEKFTNMLTDVDRGTDKLNYIVRNPLNELRYQKNLVKESIGATKDGVVDSF